MLFLYDMPMEIIFYDAVGGIKNISVSISTFELPIFIIVKTITVISYYFIIGVGDVTITSLPKDVAMHETCAVMKLSKHIIFLKQILIE